MKLTLRSLTLAAALATTPLVFTACDEGPEPPYQAGPGYGGYLPNGLPPRQTWTADEAKYYERGVDAGRRDRTLNRTSDPTRYRDDYTSAASKFYKTGYGEGYGSVPGPSMEMNPTQRSVFEQGMRAGQDDALAGKSFSYARHRGTYPHVVESHYSLGYEQGYRSAGQPAPYPTYR